MERIGYYHFSPFIGFLLLRIHVIHAQSWGRLPKYQYPGVKPLTKEEMVKEVKVYRLDRNNRPCYDSMRHRAGGK